MSTIPAGWIERLIDLGASIEVERQEKKQEKAVELNRCRRGLHCCIPVVREAHRDIVYATTCCDRLFKMGALGLEEVGVDRRRLAEIRDGIGGAGPMADVPHRR